MPSRKQRRKQAKERRHEYEYVYVDEEGRELEVDEAELEERRNGKAERRPERAQARGGRMAQPPSWRRVGKRGVIFAPLMFLTVFLLGRDELSTGQMLIQTVVLLGIFLPFSYFMDSITYRALQRRLNREKR
jgi:Flp pilus assembly protein TadB